MSVVYQLYKLDGIILARGEVILVGFQHRILWFQLTCLCRGGGGQFVFPNFLIKSFQRGLKGIKLIWCELSIFCCRRLREHVGRQRACFQPVGFKVATFDEAGGFRFFTGSGINRLTVCLFWLVLMARSWSFCGHGH